MKSSPSIRINMVLTVSNSKELDYYSNLFDCSKAAIMNSTLESFFEWLSKQDEREIAGRNLSYMVAEWDSHFLQDRVSTEFGEDE
jgi:hypothetical protein